MIVIYNPVVLLEAALAGGLSFATAKVLPKFPKTADSLLFLLILVLLDLAFRYFLVRSRPKQALAPNEPITPNKSADWGWAVSPKGGHLLFVPGWVIGAIGCAFTLIV